MAIEFKRALWVAAGATVVALFGAASPAQAQQELRATVPFDFAVGRAVLPAGDYTVSEASDPSLLVIRARNGNGAAFVVTIPDRSTQTPETPELVFIRVGDTYRLESIDMGDDLVRGVPLPAEVHKAAADHLAVRLQAAGARAN